VALVVWAAAVVPMPFYEVQPGSARPTEALVSISAATGEVRGDLSLLTTRQVTPNVAETAWIALHPERSLQPAEERAPADIDLDRYFDIQRQAFETSFLTAVAVAAEEAGYDIELRTRTVIAQVMPDGPSDGLLRAGDTITAVDGTPVESAVEVIDVLGRSDEERPVTVEVERDGEPVTVTVELRQLPRVDRPVLGIIVETITLEPDLPFEAELDRQGIVGPSAGLMLALTTADLLLEEDLAAGRVIAGTGTITADGTVGQVSGVPQKTTAALEAGADVLLVPVEQVAEASAAAEAGIEVVGVRTFQDALAALRGTAEGIAAP
jgi:PDZ domain-containing protein